MHQRTWQVTAHVIFPTHIPPDIDSDGQPQLPSQLKPEFRIPKSYREIDGIRVFLRESDQHFLDDFRYSFGELIVRQDSSAADPTSAMDAASPTIDRVLESLSFQMQCALPIDAVSVIDLTGSPVVGEERGFAQWSGFATPTFRPSALDGGRLVRSTNTVFSALHTQFEGGWFEFKQRPLESGRQDGARDRSLAGNRTGHRPAAGRRRRAGRRALRIQ